MRLMIEIVVYGGIIPTVVPLATASLLLGVLPESASRRYAAAVAFGAAFVVGYMLLPSWAEFVPTRHWHWLPYLGAAAMILALIRLAQGLSTPERWLLHLLLSAVAALAPCAGMAEPSAVAFVLRPHRSGLSVSAHGAA